MDAARPLLAAALAALASAWPLAGRAQVCEAFPSLREWRVRVAAGAATHRYAHSLGISLAAGRTVYATLDAGTTRDRELDAATLDLSVGAGADLSLDPARTAFVCPRLALAGSLGPNGYLLRDESFRYVEAAAGLGVALVALRSSGLTLTLAGGVRLARLAVTNVPGPSIAPYATGWTRSRFYGRADLEAGLTFAGRVTVRPSLSVPFGFPDPESPPPDDFIVPFGRGDGEFGVGLSVGIALGRRGRPARD